VNIKALVDRGMELRKEIDVRATELKEIEAKLKEAGLNGEHLELKDQDREGRRYLARGSSRIVPVIFTADSIVGSFKKDSAIHARIEHAAGKFFSSFFKPVNGFENLFKDGKQFRAEADQLLEKDAAQFITSCLSRDKDGIPKSGVKIEWEAAEEIIKEGK
jgi:glutaredoxin